MIWKSRKLFLIVTGFVFLIGVFHYTNAPGEFKSESKLLLEEQNQGGFSGIRALGQIGGFNLGSGMTQSGMIPADLYPDIIENAEFQNQLLFQPIYFQTYQREMTLFEYFNDYYEQPFRDRAYRTFVSYTVRLPFTLIRHARGLFSGKEAPNQAVENFVDGEFITLSPQFRYAMSLVISRISMESDGPLIEIDITMPDPVASAAINNIVTERIRDYLTEFRSEKARQNLLFVEGLHQNAKENYERAQMELALFTDRNQGNLTSLAEIERERLEDERNLRFQIYSSLSERLEDAKVRLQEDTPIFTTFQRPVLPTSPEQASVAILPFALVVGVFLGIVAVLLKNYSFLFLKYLKTLEER